MTVPAQSSAKLTVTVTPKAAFASYANANAPKGTFIDGVAFTSTDGQPDLTVPYMGFYGSWGDPVRLRRQVERRDEYYHQHVLPCEMATGTPARGSANPFQ